MKQLNKYLKYEKSHKEGIIYISCRLVAVCGYLLTILGVTLYAGSFVGIKPTLLDPSVAYAKENTSLVATESARLSVPEYIIRTNRKTGLPETVRVPKAIGEAICSKDWPCEPALRVASCESDFSTRAIGPTKDKGLFQIAPVHGYSDAQLLDRDTNIALAYKLWKSKGWKPWISSKSCWK